MLECTNCGHKQANGGFCAKCGSALAPAPEQASVEETVQSPVQPEVAVTTEQQQSNEASEPNEFLIKAKATSSNYLQYLLETLKHPSAIFDAKKPNFVNSLISFGLFSIFFALTSYLVAHKINNASIYGEAYPVPFFSTFFSAFFGIIIAIALITGAVFIISKLFGKGSSFLEVLNIYGGHSTVPLGLIIIAFLLVIVNALGMTGLLLSGAVGLLIGAIPLYIVISLLKDSPKVIDAFYGFLIYLIFIGIVSGIVFSIMADSFLGSLI